MALLPVLGISDAELSFWTDEQKDIFVKARLRRATAFLELGNLMQAHCDFVKGGNLGGDRVAQRRGVMLSQCLVPPIRVGPKCMFSQSVAWGGRIWIFGGGSPLDPFFPDPTNELLAVDPAADDARVVEVLPATGCSRRNGVPMARHRHTMVLWHHSIYIYGGQLAGSSLIAGFADDARSVWRLDLQGKPLRWERLLPRGTGPETRENHSAVVWQDGSGGAQMVVFGGQLNESQRDETADAWAFDLRQHTWRRLMATPPLRRMGVPPAGPQARGEHAAWVHEDWMYVYGGTSNSVEVAGQPNHPSFETNSFTFPSMWRLHLRELRWEPVHCRGNLPAPLAEMGVAVDPRGTVYIAGGYTTAAITGIKEAGGMSALKSAYSSEVFAFCPRKHWWRRLVAPDGQPVLGSPRAAPTACWLDGNLYVAGGYCGLQYPNVEERLVQELDVRVCAACGATKQQTPEGKLQQCSGCKAAGRASVFYCSTECANKDWPVHRIVCSDKGMAA
ncbi:hypothetical protein COHA_000111 [Chlorella ohadii]|uniref:MYND-type domain-containing protein n=1 Tax=Chlorella ohadii TaxID=2649997 RepID=A0AAD5E095_9CHLO|nr:hypothetical protein COHA_000111 [Chlorella ohadii]